MRRAVTLAMDTRTDDLLGRIAEERRWLHRFAQGITTDFRDLLPAEDLRQLVDLGIVMAWGRFQRHRRLAFTTYARRWVTGVVACAIRSEVRHRRAQRGLKTLPQASQRYDLEQATIGRDLLERIPEQRRGLLCRHFGGDERLSEIATKAGRHRSWGTRQLRRAVRDLEKARKAS